MQLRLIWQRLKATARLMVGVPDYAYYVAHMQEKHPGHAIMDEATFHQRAIESRYPGKSGNIKKCPC